MLSQLSSSSPSSSSAASATSKGAVQPPTSPQSSPAKSPTKGTSSQTTIAQYVINFRCFARLHQKTLFLGRRIQAITKPPLVARQTSSSTSQLLLQSPSSSASVRSYQTSQPPQESLVSLSGSSSGSNASEACNKSVPFLSPDLSPSPVQHETSQGLKQKTMAALFPEFVRRPIAQAPQVPGLFVNQSPVRSRQQHQLAHSDPISNKRPSEWSENDAHGNCASACLVIFLLLFIFKKTCISKSRRNQPLLLRRPLQSSQSHVHRRSRIDHSQPGHYRALDLLSLFRRLRHYLSLLQETLT